MKLKENENIPNSEVFIMEGGNQPVISVVVEEKSEVLWMEVLK